MHVTDQKHMVLDIKILGRHTLHVILQQIAGAPWNDDPCDYSAGRGYVCEKSKENIPGATDPPVDEGCDGEVGNSFKQCNHEIVMNRFLFLFCNVTHILIIMIVLSCFFLN